MSMLLSQNNFQLEDDIWWTTTAILPSWKGFQSRGGAYGSESTSAPSNGDVKIVFAPEGRGNEPLSDSEISSVVWVIENEALIAASLLSSLFTQYPKLQEIYGYIGDEKTEYMPDINSIEGFRNLIGLHAVNVHPLEKNGMPYIGFEFGCTWDAEHGLGVLMHGNRTVKISGADTAILHWIAEQDAKQP
ncbi:MAG: hypothetical protein Q7U16_12035 [Agitococcus sp.]|nr:hypothetical protein [Agitococcus sp.]